MQILSDEIKQNKLTVKNHREAWEAIFRIGTLGIKDFDEN